MKLPDPGDMGTPPFPFISTIIRTGFANTAVWDRSGGSVRPTMGSQGRNCLGCQGVAPIEESQRSVRSMEATQTLLGISHKLQIIFYVFVQI